MPEGDSLHRMANALRPHLVGERVEHLRLRSHGEVKMVRGHAVDRVEVVGKHLLLIIDRRWTLHVHLGMHGRWRLYDAGRPWTRAVASATAALVVPRTVLAIYRSACHDLYRYRDMRLEHRLRKLGPDVLATDFDLPTVVARARAPGHRDTAVTDLLLDQRVAAGIGNVYRSETLFVGGVYPWTPVGSLDDDVLGTLFGTAQSLMQSNLGPGGRATVGPHRGVRRRPEVSVTWVYRREGLPCLRCRTLVRRSIEGRQARSTYWCPRCQRPPRTV